MPKWLKVVLVFLLPLVFGFFLRLTYAEGLPEFLRIVSFAFLLAVPLSLGGLTSFLGIRFFGRHWFWIFIAPMITVLLAFILSIVTYLEATLCVIVAAPIYLPLALLGGWLASLFFKKADGRLQVSFLVLLPFVISPIEDQWEKPHQTMTVVDTIDIEASPARIWAEIASVPAIDPDELPFQWIYLLDFPRPISAEIDHEGVGGRRWARFEREVSFFEVVTEWENEKSLAFTIKADPEFIPHTAFDQHIIVGGRFYDVLDGRYEIEPLGEGRSRLHLTSNHRLSTPFNAYAGWWSEWVMRQVQGSILQVIRDRAESDAGVTYSAES